MNNDLSKIKQQLNNIIVKNELNTSNQINFDTNHQINNKV
jgi:hypothetical protein